MPTITPISVSAGSLSGRRLFAAGERLGDAEIEHFDGSSDVRRAAVLSGQEDVLRLEVAVDEMVAVCSLHGAAHAAKHRDGPDSIQPPCPAEFFAQRGAVQEFHDEERPRASLDAVVVHGDDVRVREAGHGPRLTPESRRNRGAVHPLVANHLYRDPSIQRDIDRLVHLAHSAASQALLQAIPSRERPRHADGNQLRLFVRAE